MHLKYILCAFLSLGTQALAAGQDAEPSQTNLLNKKTLRDLPFELEHDCDEEKEVCEKIESAFKDVFTILDNSLQLKGPINVLFSFGYNIATTGPDGTDATGYLVTALTEHDLGGVKKSQALLKQDAESGHGDFSFKYDMLIMADYKTKFRYPSDPSTEKGEFDFVDTMLREVLRGLGWESVDQYDVLKEGDGLTDDVLREMGVVGYNQVSTRRNRSRKYPPSRAPFC